MTLKQTPSQTVGPYFAYGLAGQQYGYPFKSIASSQVANEDTEGQHIRILGQVFDGAGDIIPDALIEIWQANAFGRYNHPEDPRRDNSDPKFKGFGRFGTGTDPLNRFIFDTVKPGAIGDGQAPHINVIVMMRGMLVHAFTRLYFDDEAEANAGDPVLCSVPEDRRHTLIAKRDPLPTLPRERGREGWGPTVYRFDIHMQGDKETVFFDV